MPMYVLNRDFTLATTSGHRIKFKAGEETYVPPACVPSAVAIGATPADGSDPNVLPPDPMAEPAAASDPVARKAAIVEAIDSIITHNVRENFNAANQPKAEAVSKFVGFKVDDKETKRELTEYYESKAG